MFLEKHQIIIDQLKPAIIAEIEYIDLTRTKLKSGRPNALSYDDILNAIFLCSDLWY